MEEFSWNLSPSWIVLDLPPKLPRLELSTCSLGGRFSHLAEMLETASQFSGSGAMAQKKAELVWLGRASNVLATWRCSGILKLFFPQRWTRESLIRSVPIDIWWYLSSWDRQSYPWWDVQCHVKEWISKTSQPYFCVCWNVKSLKEVASLQMYFLFFFCPRKLFKSIQDVDDMKLALKLLFGKMQKSKASWTKWLREVCVHQYIHVSASWASDLCWHWAQCGSWHEPDFIFCATLPPIIMEVKNGFLQQ